MGCNTMTGEPTVQTEAMSRVMGTLNFSWHNHGGGIFGFLNGGNKLKKSVGINVRLEMPHDDGRVDMHDTPHLLVNGEANYAPGDMKIAIVPISYIGYHEARCIVEIPVAQIGELIEILQRTQMELMAKNAEYNLNRAVERYNLQNRMLESEASTA